MTDIITTDSFVSNNFISFIYCTDRSLFKYQLWCSFTLASSFLTPVYAEHNLTKDHSFQIHSDHQINVPYNERGTLPLKVKYAYKAWTLMGEPVEDCMLKWSFPMSSMHSFELFNPYTEQWERVSPPQEVVLKSRLNVKDIEVAVGANAIVNCDAGSLGKGGLQSFAGHDAIEASPSFNVPGSPEWDELFLFSGVVGNITRNEDGRVYLAESEAKRLLKSLIGTRKNANFWSIKYIDAELEISAIERWFMKQAKQKATKSQLERVSQGNTDQGLTTNKSNHIDVQKLKDSLKRVTEDRNTSQNLGEASVSNHDNNSGVKPTDPTRQHITAVSQVAVPLLTNTNKVDSSMLLLIDTSGSMGGERLKEAKLAAIELINKSVSNGTEIAVMAFSGECSNPIVKRHDFSLDSQSLKGFVRSLRASGGTPMSAAVEYANTYLSKNKSSVSVSEMILLLADGEDNCDILTPVVRELRSKGILFRHQTVGLELRRNSNAAKELKYLANTSGGDYASASNAKQLSQTFENAAVAMGILSLIGSYKSDHGGSSGSHSQQSLWDGFGD